jgi:hypothetical protein
VVSSTRKDFPWTNSHHIAGDLRTGVQKLKNATPAGVLLGSGTLATELDRLDLIDEYKLNPAGELRAVASSHLVSSVGILGGAFGRGGPRSASHRPKVDSRRQCTSRGRSVSVSAGVIGTIEALHRLTPIHWPICS